MELKVCHTIKEFRDERRLIEKNKKIGFVPTMGGLHEGHLNLLRKAREENDIVIASIFVNPKQFAPTEDFNSYPRTLQTDIEALQRVGVDLLYAPKASDLYPPNFCVYVLPEGYDDTAEGRCRPGFFKGVATVVTKLFNIIDPTDVYFGQKDATQCALIKNLIHDLNFDIHLHIVETMRETDGLAMSTRNQYLNTEERKRAIIIYQGLKKAYEEYLNAKENHRNLPASQLRQTIETIYQTEPLVKEIQYISIVSKENPMEELEIVDIHQGAIVSVAVLFSNYRLIDNLVF